MTLLCGGGTSQIKAGVAGNNIISGGLISEGLGSISPWLLPLALLIDAFLYDATAQCTSDPPALPTFSSTDLTNCIGGILNPNCQTTLDKVKNLLLRYLWFQFCECTSTGTPTFVNPVQPPNTGTSVLPPNNTDCWSTQVLAFTPLFNTTAIFTGSPRQDIGGIGLGFGGNPNRFGGYNAFATLPAGAVTITWTITVHSEGALPLPIRFFIGAWTAGNAEITSAPYHALVASAVSPGNTQSFSFTIVPAAGLAEIDFFPCYVASGTTVGTNTFDMQVAVQCSAFNVAPVNCAQEAEILALLQLLYQLASQIYQGLPVPLRSFAESVVHSGLTGSGNFATAAGAIGCKVSFTVPTQLGEAAGDPTTIFDAGWLTTSAVEGNYKSRRLEHNPELVLFDPVVDTVHYTLHPGVTATITEIVRGP